MSTDFSLNKVQVSSSPQERFEEYLQSKGQRITQQRRSLVDHVFSRHEHFDADELVESLNRSAEETKADGNRSDGNRADSGRISRATVYRTLDELVKAGLLRKMTLGNRAVYEHDYGYPQHDHLHCQECESLIEFQSEELLVLREAVAGEHQFRVTGHRLIITGVCQACAAKRHRRHSPLDLV